MNINLISSGSAHTSPTAISSPEDSREKLPMCKSLYDTEPCCCPDWVIEEMLDSSEVDIDDDPDLQQILSRDCVSCDEVGWWIDDKEAASPDENAYSRIPDYVFDAIMGFFKSDEADTRK